MRKGIDFENEFSSKGQQGIIFAKFRNRYDRITSLYGFAYFITRVIKRNYFNFIYT